MSTPINMKKPLKLNGQDVYPPTTSQQVLMKDGRRLDAWLEGEKYELIASVVTTEEINTLNITTGNDGNNYALKKAIFEIVVPAATATKPFVLFVNNMYALYSAKVVDTKNKQTFLCVDIVNGRLLATHYGCTGISNSGQDDGGMLYYPVRFSSAADNIYHFQVYGVNSAVLPVGTTVKIWGIKA